MAGYETIYVFGGEGGFQGADGVNPIELQIWVGSSDRPWLEAKPFSKKVKGLGRVRVVIPGRDNRRDALLDACIAFHADAFASCPSLASVERDLGDATHLDFHLGPERIPKDWAALREEARPIFDAMPKWVARLEPVEDGPLL